jgi:hypothetical protein
MFDPWRCEGKEKLLLAVPPQILARAAEVIE